MTRPSQTHEAAPPMTSAEASRYQKLRTHLTTLKLTAAAEHLPAVLDAARAENLSMTVTLEPLLVATCRYRPKPHPRCSRSSRSATARPRSS